MSWKPIFGLLILVMTVTNFALGLAIKRFAKKSKWILIAGLVFNLGTLVFYKYTNFILKSLIDLGTSCLRLGFSINPSWLSFQPFDIFLPLGISFFAFEFIHFIVDVYHGSAPIRDFRHFALFASFFPSQIAGPIKRFQDFEKQLQSQPPFNKEVFQRGIFLIFRGLFKKIVLGDNLDKLVRYGFSNPYTLGTVDAWIAAIAFTLQLYFDFSGYTDIGRGSAYLVGYSVPENFRSPYLAANLKDFWRRWHISLSTWLRDYLFIPLGGSHGSHWLTKRNLLITMLLGGLWHGASWNFVCWGAFHGVGLILTRDWQNFVDGLNQLGRLRQTKIWHLTGVFLTFTFVVIAGVFFRSTDTQCTITLLSKMSTFSPSETMLTLLTESTLPVGLSLYFACVLIAQIHSHQTSTIQHVCKTVESWWCRSLPAQLVTYASTFIIVLAFAPDIVRPFIYFQF
jgi:alginate O-acetyltransferase complex protein AlgI